MNLILDTMSKNRIEFFSISIDIYLVEEVI
jgi:hypothetical protein